MSTPFSCFAYDEWKTYIENANTEAQVKLDCLAYLGKCEEMKIPYILSFKQLPYIFSIDIKVLSTMVTFPEQYYRMFSIPKRSGGERKIATPYPSLYYVQKWILENILNKISINENAKGFCCGRSIISHAETHLNSKSLLKTDIIDFFPSITLRRIIAAFKYIGYPSRVASTLARFCCLNKVLPQGASTSPMLSNIVCNKMDNRLNLVSEKYKLAYSRYADDLAFSGEYVPSSFLPVVEKILDDEGFLINKKKTIIINGRGKKILTGISISNGKLSIPREKRRLLRTEAYMALKNDPTQTIIAEGDPIYYERLLGKYGFWHLLEPNNDYVEITINKLKVKMKEIT